MRRFPVIVATWKFGRQAVQEGWRILARGGSVLDAVEAAGRRAEDDPRVNSVGYGGLPNAEGRVQLDACIMDGSTLGFGSVAGLENIKNPVSVARRVMERTRHLMLVGEGARRFARTQGFKHENLLTAASRRAYKKHLDEMKHPSDWHDTIGILAIDRDGHIAGACTTSGAPWKLPGRVGDSPIIGCGLYADDRAGAAVGTGVGEEIMRVTAAAVIVEQMRRGATPAAATREACRRIAANVRGIPWKPGAGLLAIDRFGRVGACGTHRGYFLYAVGHKGRVGYRMAPGILPAKLQRHTGWPQVRGSRALE